MDGLTREKQFANLPSEVQQHLLQLAVAPPVILRSLVAVWDRLAAVEVDELSRLGGLTRYFARHLSGSAEALDALEAVVRLCVAMWMVRRGESGSDLELLLGLLDAQLTNAEESDLLG